jgi:hypothetical protein
MAKKIMGALASSGVSRGSTGRGMQSGDDMGERESEPPEAPPVSLADQRRRSAAAAVSRPLSIADLTNNRARNIDLNQAERDGRLASTMAGIEQAGYAAAGRTGGTSEAEYIERIRRARGY